MKLSNDVIAFAKQLGWFAVPVVTGYDNHFMDIIPDKNDIEIFAMECGEPDYWYGTPIPGTESYTFISPEEIVEMYDNQNNK